MTSGSRPLPPLHTLSLCLRSGPPRQGRSVAVAVMVSLLLGAVFSGCVSPPPPRRPLPTPPREMPAPKPSEKSTPEKPPVTPVQPAPKPDVSTEKSRVSRAFESGNYPQVVEEYEKLLQRYPSHVKGADDLYYYGYSLLETGRHEAALAPFLEFQHRFSKDSRTSEVFYRLGQIFRRLGRYERSMSFLGQAIHFAEDDELREKAWMEKGDILAEKGLLLESLDVFDDAYTTADGNGRNKLLEKIDRVLQLMPSRSLEKVLTAQTYSFPLDRVRRFYARSLEKEGKLEEARQQWEQIASSGMPAGEVERADRRVQELKEIQEKPLVKVGVLLPESERLEVFSRQVRQGVEMAIEEIAGSDYPYLVEAVYRPEGRGDEAAEELVRMISIDNIAALIGPLLSSTVERVVNVAETHSLAVYSPTASSPRLKGISPVYFSDCLTLGELSGSLARFATKSLELRRYVLLVPDEVFGWKIADLFADAVAEQGGEVIARQGYATDLTDFGAPIRALKAAAGIPDPVPEYFQLPFDAVFMPGYADQVGMIIPQLAFHDIDVKQLTILGGSGLNTDRFPRVGEDYAEGTIFVDGFFAGHPRLEIQRFVDGFRKKFNEAPGTFSAQSYAATSRVLRAIRRVGAVRQEVFAALLEEDETPDVLDSDFPVTGSPGSRAPFFISVEKGSLVSVSADPAGM